MRLEQRVDFRSKCSFPDTVQLSQYTKRRSGAWDFRKLPEVAPACQKAVFSLQRGSPEPCSPAEWSREGPGRDLGAGVGALQA